MRMMRHTATRSSRNYGERREPATDREGTRERPTRMFRKKVCRFCVDRVLFLDYKDSESLRRSLTEKGKIMPRRITGTCAPHQRLLARAIKRSRHSGLIPFQME